MKKTQGYRHKKECDCKFCSHIGQFKEGNQLRKGKEPWNKGKDCPQLKGENNGFFGKTHSEKTKKRFSKIRKGKKLCEEHKIKIGLSLKGRIFTQEHLVKISGVNSYMWEGGKSFEPYPPEFNNQLKKKIKERDNYECKFCGSINDLTIHHIDYDKNNNDFNNLITLCRGHNAMANFNKNYWIGYYKNKLLTCSQTVC